MIWSKRLLQSGYFVTLLAIVFAATMPGGCANLKTGKLNVLSGSLPPGDAAPQTNVQASNSKADAGSSLPPAPPPPAPRVLNPSAVTNGAFIGGAMQNMSQYVNGSFFQNGGGFQNGSYVNSSTYMGGGFGSSGGYIGGYGGMVGGMRGDVYGNGLGQDQSGFNVSRRTNSDPLAAFPSMDWAKPANKSKEAKPSDSKVDKDKDSIRSDSVARNKDETKGAAETKKPEIKPQVWRRNGAQPTMARVYVGDGNSLDMVSLHVSVVIDGSRARTTVDHIFRNPHAKQLEGTFEYPLPTGASPSYFAMFLGGTRDTMPPLFANRRAAPPLPLSAVAQLTPTQLVSNIDSTDWGRLQEARVVGKAKATEAYEDVVRGRIDPALLEYASGNTFRGRVFPIAPKGYNRVLLAYEELLPVVEGQLLYRFPLPDLPVHDVQFTLTANSKQCVDTAFLPKDAQKESGGGQVSYTKTWTNEAPKERLVLFAGTPVDPRIQAVCGQQGDNGPYHLYARLRPDLKKIEKTKPFASHAVFLLDTSLSEHPDRFNVNMKLLKKILENDADIKHFNILTFNVGGAWVELKGWLDNDAAGREKALAKLDGIVLEGATDLDTALTRLRNPDFAVEKGVPLNVFVLSDGHITWGETDVNTIVSRYETNTPFPSRFYCYRVGLGEENAELFDALARKGGGVFNCLTEPEMTAAATAHRNRCFTVEGIRFVGGPEANDVLIAGRKVAVYPGGELVVAAKLAGPAKGKLIVEGQFQGERLTQTFPLDISSHSETAARAWGEVAVTSLLALNDAKLDALVTAYCQQYGVASRAASFLVLENEADYKRLNLKEERGKTVNGDLREFIDNLWRQLGAAKSARQAFIEFLDRIEPRVKLVQGAQAQHVQRLLALLTDKEFELPPSAIHGTILRKSDVPPGYLAQREQDRRNVGVYLQEAKRRAADGDIDGAVRVLSSVIEEHPGRGDALRLVGYRLLDMRQPDQAAHLFQQVQRQRPFEPHSYRDLARSLEDSGLYGLAAVQYEIVLAGTWHARFHDSFKLVVQEEYARVMQDAIRRGVVSKALANHFGERLERMASPQPQSDLRVTIAWNTDATDVDLWVIEPDGTKCFYQHNRTKNGGELSQDQTQGYGPERYQTAKALPGEYKVMVHYYGANPNLLGGETHVNVLVTRFAGTPQETTARHTVILKKAGEETEVCKVKY
jgi:von Willebrand factor type A domain/Vault protein inter-alpha-trypsin domain